MAEFLTTRQGSARLEEIITKAEREICILSPYIMFPSLLLQRLKDAGDRGVRITLVYGKRELRDDEQEPLCVLRNLNLRYCHDLHAKCYLNENLLLITSMNLHQFSENNNHEMGVLISRNHDADLFKSAVEETKAILRHSETRIARTNVLSGPRESQKKQQTQERTTLTCHCIRCNKPLTLNSEAPLCSDCYEVWARYKDPDYEEKYCHVCGQFASTTKAKPLCRKCYNDAKRT